MPREVEPREFEVYTAKHLEHIPQVQALPESMRTRMRAVAAVLPFRVNSYVVERLIDWSRVPDDPIYQLTFPQPGMLEPAHLHRMESLIQAGAPLAVVRAEARRIQMQLNPHPAGQMQINVPRDQHGAPIPGLQHKYRETVLFFPAQGQTCHAYCSYCFRWAQFVGIPALRFSNRDARALASYVAAHPEVESVLLTGGDPMVMKATALRRIIEPLLRIEHVRSIRIGTKSLAYWPHRFLTEPDAEALLRLFEQVVASGRNLAFMAHFSHPRELATPEARAALRRVLQTGAVVRTQAPLIAHVNDSVEAWAEMWREQVRLGMVPYYMFVERDTGARHYFEVPLVAALRIFEGAFRRVGGLARTVRGPSMSATPGKVLIDGVVELEGKRALALKFLQARDPSWVGRIFFARYDERATWLDQLRPAFGATEFFYEAALRKMLRDTSTETPIPSAWMAPANAEAE